MVDQLPRRWAADGITANAVHPGAIAETNLSRHMNREELAALRESGTFRFKTLGQGAATFSNRFQSSPTRTRAARSGEQRSPTR